MGKGIGTGYPRSRLDRQSACHPIPALALLLTIYVMLGGCAGAPPEEKAPEAVPAQKPADEVILDARLLAGNDNLETAAVMLEDLVEREKYNIEALKLLASVYAAMGRKEESVSTWERISVLDPSDADAAYEVGAGFARKGDWKALRARMLAAEMAGAADSRHYLLLGEADMALGYKGEAEKYLKMANEHERGRYLLGKLYYGQGKLMKAERAFKEVLAGNPDMFSAHLHLGWIYYDGGKHGKALNHYENAVRIRPGDPLARLSLAGLFEEIKRPDEAIKHYKDALSRDGIPREEKKKVYNSLSRLLVSRERTAEAVSVINEGLREFPGSGGLYFQWGEALLKEGKKDHAREKYKLSAGDPLWRETALRRLHSIR
jgi:tetratricopeptide (TPR) repeat protein